MFDLPSQDKRRIQEEIAKKRRQIEEEKLKLQYIKKKALREQWLMDGLSQQSEEEQEAMRLQAQEEQQQSDHLQSNIIRMEKEIEALEAQELNISANEEIVVKRLKEVERTAEDIIKEVHAESQPDVTHHVPSPLPDMLSLIPLAAAETHPVCELASHEPKKATFAMKISVEHDKKTGKSHVVSAATIIPETIQKNGIKVYDDGHKSVYALHPGITKIHSETVGEMTPTEVEELLHQVADKNVPTEVQYHLPVYSVPYIGMNRPSTPRKSTKSLTKNSKPSPLQSVNSFKNGSLILNEKKHCSQGLQEQKSPNKTPLSICQDSTPKVRRVGERANLHSREQAKCETFLIPQSHFSTECPRAFANSTTDTSSPNTAALVSVKFRPEGMPVPKEPIYRALDRSSSSLVHHKFDPDPLLGSSGDSNKDLPSCAENVSLNPVSTLPGELKLEPISMIFMGYKNAEEEEEDIQAELVIIDNSSDNNDNDEDETEINREEYLLYHPKGYRSKVFQPKLGIAKVIELRDIIKDT
uniref:Palmdelphin n=2 Tax=Oreochromis niloticus TaxID=8128 RepID=A0A669E185_ORENI